MSKPDQLKLLLDTPELAWLVRKLRETLESGRPLPTRVGLANPSAAQRAAADALLGRMPSDGKRLIIPLDALEAALARAKLCESLAEAVELLCGPIQNKRIIRENRRRTWEAVFDNVAGSVGSELNQQPAFCRWLHDLQAFGFLKRLTRGDELKGAGLLKQAMAAIVRLPEQGVLLAELAADVAGDAHALDRDQPLGRLLMRYAAIWAKQEVPGSVDAWRRLWSRVGVECDPLSAPVLVLNIRAESSTLTGRVSALFAQDGEPWRISSRQLLRNPPVFSRSITGDTVYLCENPNVVAAAADRIGASCKPLVCLEGQPKTAGMLLLRRLSLAGIRLCYHGDFDWPGIGIANLIMRHHPATPWRMAVADYRAAAMVGGTRLDGSPIHADWDPDLAPAMAKLGRAIHEEQVITDLLNDLHIRRHAQC